MPPFAEEKGPDQRKDARVARTRATLQQGENTISCMLVLCPCPIHPFLAVPFILLTVQADKASVLDEAIEYLKFLQMQVQV